MRQQAVNVANLETRDSRRKVCGSGHIDAHPARQAPEGLIVDRVGALVVDRHVNEWRCRVVQPNVELVLEQASAFGRAVLGALYMPAEALNRGIAMGATRIDAAPVLFVGPVAIG